MKIPHLPVLLHEILQTFNGMKLKVFVDCTLGAGGHAAALLEAHPEIELFIGMDQDPEALEIAGERLSPWNNKIKLVHANYSRLSEFVDRPIDGILMDLGVSSMQLDRPAKGFSFMNEGPLDMRMDPTNPVSAYDIVNTYEERELGLIFRDLGEEKQWRKAAYHIVQERQKGPIKTTKQLVTILSSVLHYNKKKGINPMTLIFQGLRIAVNRELDVLEETIPQAVNLMSSGGRCAVISFHSLEDRIVKTLFRYLASDKEDTSGRGGVFIDKIPTIHLVTRKPLIATDEEVAQNPRSRSAKLRVAQRL